MTRPLIAASASALVTLTLFVLPTSSGATGLSPSAVLAEAIHNADRAGWVHEVNTTYVNGSFAGTMVDDVGSREGRQITKFPNGGVDTLIAFDAAKRLYEKANALGLSDYQITSNAYYANKWMTETPSNPGYTYNALGTTLKSDFSQFPIASPVTLGPITTIRGQAVRALSGKAPAGAELPNATVIIYVTEKGPILPVSISEKTKSETFTESWSRWGQPVKLSVPSPTVPYPTSGGTTTE
jgi:hypothetical protein